MISLLVVHEQERSARGQGFSFVGISSKNFSRYLVVSKLSTRLLFRIALGVETNISYFVKNLEGAIPTMSVFSHKLPHDVPPRLTKILESRKTFAALRHPNYRLWFQGQIVSLFGTWMQATAQGFLVYQITESPAYLGYVGFASGIPAWVLTLYGGVVADRVPRRTLLIVTQISMMVFAFVLAALTFLNVVQPWHILVLSFLLGTANAFDAPARQAFVSEMVDQEDLTNAIALNATMFNFALAAGPAVAGITYAAFGPGWCFTINGLSFIAVIVALWKMKFEPLKAKVGRESVVHELKEGLRHVINQRVIRGLFIVIAVNQLLVFSMSTLLPAWSVSILRGDATTNGFLFSARGAGSLIGALVIASLGNFAYRGKLLTLGLFLTPLFLIVFALVPWLAMSLLVLFGIGIGTILVLNLTNAMIQTLTPERLRGRVMGAYTWIFFGFMPLGALLTGWMADLLGLSQTVVINGALALVSAVLIWFYFPKLREQ
jgi:MFS family permease